MEAIQSSIQHGFEAWICTYDYGNPNLIYSGGDDCKMKVLDVRSNHSVVIGKNSHDAGVTSLLSDRFDENRVFSGR